MIWEGVPAMYRYQTLEEVSLEEIAACLNLAFSDYDIPLCLTEAELAHLFRTSGVDESRSFGAFCGDQMVGFMLHSCGLYHGQEAAFNVGTGVVPEHRGNGISTDLFSLAEQVLRQTQIKSYYLEVLQQNEGAIRLYKKQGFSVTREFAVLRASAPTGSAERGKVEYMEFDRFDLDHMGQCRQIGPSYEHSTGLLRRNPELYEVAYRREDGVSAFCVFSKADGQILQLGCRSVEELKPVIQSLLSRVHPLTAKNIDQKEREVLEMLAALGFKTAAKQFEMVKRVDS